MKQSTKRNLSIALTILILSLIITATILLVLNPPLGKGFIIISALFLLPELLLLIGYLCSNSKKNNSEKNLEMDNTSKDSYSKINSVMPDSSENFDENSPVTSDIEAMKSPLPKQQRPTRIDPIILNLTKALDILKMDFSIINQASNCDILADDNTLTFNLNKSLPLEGLVEKINSKYGENTSSFIEFNQEGFSQLKISSIGIQSILEKNPGFISNSKSTAYTFGVFS